MKDYYSLYKDKGDDMEYIWNITKSCEDMTKRRSIFMKLNMLIWGLVFFVCAFLCLIFFLSPVKALLYSALAGGYGLILVGIYGGAVFLYKK